MHYNHKLSTSCQLCQPFNPPVLLPMPRLYITPHTFSSCFRFRTTISLHHIGHCPSRTHSSQKKMVIKGRFLRAFLYKWRKLSNGTYESCWCGRWPCFNGDDELIPRDVPKGHLVVYVGEDCMRYVIRVSFLDHPLFKALLERAREEYEFTPDMRLCIPCDENTFANILRCVTKYQKRRTCLLRRF